MPAGKVTPLDYNPDAGAGYRRVHYEPAEGLYYAEWYVD